MTTRSVPWPKYTADEIKKNVISGQRPLMKIFDDNFGNLSFHSTVKELIQGCWDHNIQTRWTIEMAFKTLEKIKK